MSGQRERRQFDEHLSDELLSAYLDGQVTGAERARVDAHLADCAACAVELRALQATVGVLREMPPAPLPRAFTIPATVPAGRASLWDTLTRGWGYRALQGATALAMTLLMTLCAGDLLQTLFMVPMAAPLPGASEAVATRTTNEALLAAAPTPRPGEARQTAVSGQPTAEGRAATRPPEPTAAPAPTTPPVREQASQTQVPQVAGAASPATSTPAPPAPVAPATPSPAAAKASEPTPAGAWRAQVVPTATATATGAEADTAASATPTEARTPTAEAHYQPSTPAPPPEPASVAQPPTDLVRLTLCGVEGVLLVATGGLLLVTGMAWFARRGR